MADVTDSLPDTIAADRQDGRWVSPAQAAATLGVSERTIHRRLAANRYRVRHVDGRTLVHLPSDRRPTHFAQQVSDADPTAAGDASDDVTDTSDDHLERPTLNDRQPTDAMADAVSQAIGVLDRLLEQERRRTEEERSHADQERERASAAEQAAAMWQERARNLETQVEQLLALPAHEAEPPGRRWWQFWR